MASSLQIYAGRHERFNDIDLLIITSMVIDFIHEHQSTYHSLAESVKYWEENITGYAPGIIRLNLDEELYQDAARHAFLLVLSEVRAKLASFGESIPIESLKSLAMYRLWGGYGTITFSQPQRTDQLLATVANLEKLVGDFSTLPANKA